ncbi:MAG TPA: hypothetical protein VJI73_01675 [Candidatus Paceibacterota bacterium]
MTVVAIPDVRVVEAVHVDLELATIDVHVGHEHGSLVRNAICVTAPCRASVAVFDPGH